jgi:hypothetical protein
MKGGLPYTFDEPLPEGTRVTPVRLLAEDDFESSGWLYEPAQPTRTVVALAHPRAEFGRHYAIPGLVRAGLAAFGQNARYLNNDTEAVRDRVLYDVAAGQRWLRTRFDKVALLGNSGGGTLFASYQAEAERTKKDPPGDGLIVLAAHAGEGRFLMNTIDPSVTDEADPLSCDPALDMFHPDNGYDPATRTARYAPEFLAHYRAAQRARVARLDEQARAQIESERAARGTLAGQQGYAFLLASRRAIPHRLLTIYRTVANPAYLDLSIDPNDRDVGSIFGLFHARPEFGNYFGLNVARVL